MKDRDFKKQRKRVNKIAKKWLHVLGLKWWYIEIKCRDERKLSEMAEGRQVLMSTTSLWCYLEATIVVFLPTIAEIDDNELECAFVHECMHILVNELREDDYDGRHEERVCETLAKAFRWTEELL